MLMLWNNLDFRRYLQLLENSLDGPLLGGVVLHLRKENALFKNNFQIIFLRSYVWEIE